METNDQSMDLVRDVFIRAMAHSEGVVRQAFLQESCMGDAELLGEVTGLLKAHGSPGGFLSRDASGKVMSDGPELIGTTVGHYHISARLGEGGFGEVFRAKQREPFQREVALKIVKLGMDTKKVLARFEVERQALARMDHSGIAQIYDAGITASGRPYFVMELVLGVPFIAYCNQHQLPLNDRLLLFRQVCGAIQHAHQKGILHRDLKPSNILVSEENGKPSPKVIDFGVAKVLWGQLAEDTISTLQDMVIGTPLYMSPEQLTPDNSNVDTRTDIYSLGMILYELVAGVTPLENKGVCPRTLAHMRQALRKGELPRPSRRIHMLGDRGITIAVDRQIRLPTLKKLLHGDLDWIVMKAIETEHDRRYGDVGALAKDLDRYLRHEPVLAGPPGMVYRTRKFIRRHRMGTVTVASAGLTLLIGAGVSTSGFLRATQEAEQARQQAAIAETTYRFIMNDLLGQVQPGGVPDRDIKLRTIIDQAGERVALLTDQPLVQARIHRFLASLYRSLGEYDDALKHTARAEWLESGRDEAEAP